MTRRPPTLFPPRVFKLQPPFTPLLRDIVIPSIPPRRPPSPTCLSGSCLGPVPGSSSAEPASPALHAEVLGEGGQPRRQRGRARSRARRHRRRRRRRREGGGQVGRGGDDLVLAVPRHFRTLAGHRFLHRLHRVLRGKRQRRRQWSGEEISISISLRDISCFLAPRGLFEVGFFFFVFLTCRSS